MSPRITIIVAVLLLVVAPLAGEAQQTGKVWRIGVLSLNSDIEPYKRWHAAFREGLGKLGYVEGDNLIIEQRYAAGHVERLSALAVELVRLKVDIFVTAPAGSALFAKKATSIPKRLELLKQVAGRLSVSACERVGGSRPRRTDLSSR